LIGTTQSSWSNYVLSENELEDLEKIKIGKIDEVVKHQEQIVPTEKIDETTTIGMNIPISIISTTQIPVTTTTQPESQQSTAEETTTQIIVNKSTTKCSKNATSVMGTSTSPSASTSTTTTIQDRPTTPEITVLITEPPKLPEIEVTKEVTKKTEEEINISTTIENLTCNLDSKNHQNLLKTCQGQNLITAIKHQINNNKAIIFSKTYCRYSKRAKFILNHYIPGKYKVIEVNLLPTEVGEELQDFMLEYTGARTVPRVFINRIIVGGSDDLRVMRKSGELKRLLRENYLMN